MPRFRTFVQCFAVLGLGLIMTGCAKKACSTCRGDGGDGGGWTEAQSQFYSSDGYAHDGMSHGHPIEGGTIHGSPVYGESIQHGAGSFE